MKQKLSHFGTRIVGQSMFKLLARAKDLERKGKKIIHFEIGDTHLEMPDPVKDTAMRSLRNKRTHYGASHGEYELRSAIARVYKEDYRFLPDINQIVVASGANPLIYYIISVLVNPKEEVILTDPSFVTYNAVLNMLDVTGVRIPVSHHDNFRFDPEKIRKSITKKTRLIVLNSPSNPTGAVYSKNDIKKIYEIAKRHNIYVLSDEIYSTLVYEGTHFSAGTLDKCRERVIVTNGFSKPFAMTGWRVGYAIGPAEIIDKVGLLSQTIVSCVPPFLQDACVTALKNRKVFAKKYFNEYKKLREVICSQLERIPELQFEWPQGAFYIFIDVSKTGMDGDEFSEYLMQNEGVVVCPGSGFGPSGKNYIRICYAKEKEVLLEGCKKITHAIEKIR